MEDKSQFAGFWKRFLAFLIDFVAVSIVGFIINFSLGLCIGIVLGMMHVETMTIRVVAGLFGLIFGLILHLLYWSIFESSKLQATPGKLALGIVVTDAVGGRITFWRALGRNAAKLISSFFFCLGYIICSFTERRQAAHDLLAGTLVVDKNAPLRVGPGQTFNIMQQTE